MEGNDQAARAEDAKHRTGYYPPIRGMIMENLYKQEYPTVSGRVSNDEYLQRIAWNEGHQSRDNEVAMAVISIATLQNEAKSRAEIVNELVGACKQAEFALHNSTGSIGQDAAAALRAAILRAREE